MIKIANKPSKNWLRMGNVYKFFAKDYPETDFSDNAMLAMFRAETYGGEYKFGYYDRTDGKFNGYAVGKHLMDIQIAMWYEDLSQFGQLTKFELMTDPQLEPIKEFLVELFGYSKEDLEHLTKPLSKGNIQISSNVYKYIHI